MFGLRKPQPWQIHLLWRRQKWGWPEYLMLLLGLRRRRRNRA